MSGNEIAVKCSGITKTFGGVVANDDINLEVKYGEILALLGENGSGKTTLMNMLSGIYHPDEGTIHIAGQEVSIRSPEDSMALGIGMIYQHFKLVKPFSVAENIVLSDDHVKVINKKKLEARVKALSERYCIEIDPGALTWQLSIGEQQRVEILKVLYRNANILILDEPTRGIDIGTKTEIQKLVLQLADEGKAVTFISSEIEEMLRTCSRMAVLRDGQKVGELEEDELSQSGVMKAIAGGDDK